ncbi:MAG: FtsQ-type POTRA domain-containing protein [Clostridia bacterium]|nr:FtsQ-type POTRA domain-containing protein [Clostridia bacterium]
MTAEITDLQKKKKQLIRKKRRNRIKRRLVVFAFLFVCMAIIFTVLKAPFFNVKSILCVGQQTLTEEQIIKIAGAKTGANIFSTAVKTMERRLSEDPNIETCNVRRLYPNRIKIWVREAKALAYVQSNGLFLFVDKTGQIIKVADQKETEATKGVARLDGIEPATTKLGEYIFATDDPVHQKTFECMEILTSLEMIDKVSMISATDLSDIKVDYDERLFIMLGSYEKMEYKLTFVKKVISQNLSDYEKAILDYRGQKLYVGPRTTDKPEAENETTEVAEDNAGKEDAEDKKQEDEKTNQNQE